MNLPVCGITHFRDLEGGRKRNKSYEIPNICIVTAPSPYPRMQFVLRNNSILKHVFLMKSVNRISQSGELKVDVSTNSRGVMCWWPSIGGLKFVYIRVTVRNGPILHTGDVMQDVNQWNTTFISEISISSTMSLPQRTWLEGDRDVERDRDVKGGSFFSLINQVSNVT